MHHHTHREGKLVLGVDNFVIEVVTTVIPHGKVRSDLGDYYISSGELRTQETPGAEWKTTLPVGIYSHSREFPIASYHEYLSYEHKPSASEQLDDTKNCFGNLVKKLNSSMDLLEARFDESTSRITFGQPERDKKPKNVSHEHAASLFAEMYKAAV